MPLSVFLSVGKCEPEVRGLICHYVEQSTYADGHLSLHVGLGWYELSCAVQSVENRSFTCNTFFKNMRQGRSIAESFVKNVCLRSAA